MLHRTCQQYSCIPEAASAYTKLYRKLIVLCCSRGESSASLQSKSCPSDRNAMEAFRQRRASNRLAARSHVMHNPTDLPEPANTLQAQPATKKRKTTAVKPAPKGLKGQSRSQRQSDAPATLAEEATSSADTVFDAAPAIPSAPSGVPVSIPAQVPADPSILHCWTKDSMAQAAAYLAERDPGCSVTSLYTPVRTYTTALSDLQNILLRSVMFMQRLHP